MNFHQVNLLNRSSKPRNQNIQNLPDDSGSFTGALKEPKKNVGSVAKSRSNTTKKKGDNALAKRKAILYLLRGTKKTVVEKLMIDY